MSEARKFGLHEKHTPTAERFVDLLRADRKKWQAVLQKSAEDKASREAAAA